MNCFAVCLIRFSIVINLDLFEQKSIFIFYLLAYNSIHFLQLIHLIIICKIGYTTYTKSKSRFSTLSSICSLQDNRTSLGRLRERQQRCQGVRRCDNGKIGVNKFSCFFFIHPFSYFIILEDNRFPLPLSRFSKPAVVAWRCGAMLRISLEIDGGERANARVALPGGWRWIVTICSPRTLHHPEQWTWWRRRLGCES